MEVVQLDDDIDIDYESKLFIYFCYWYWCGIIFQVPNLINTFATHSYLN